MKASPPKSYALRPQLGSCMAARRQLCQQTSLPPVSPATGAQPASVLAIVGRGAGSLCETTEVNHSTCIFGGGGWAGRDRTAKTTQDRTAQGKTTQDETAQGRTTQDRVYTQLLTHVVLPAVLPVPCPRMLPLTRTPALEASLVSCSGKSWGADHELVVCIAMALSLCALFGGQPGSQQQARADVLAVAC